LGGVPEEGVVKKPWRKKFSSPEKWRQSRGKPKGGGEHGGHTHGSTAPNNNSKVMPTLPSKTCMAYKKGVTMFGGEGGGEKLGKQSKKGRGKGKCRQGPVRPANMVEQPAAILSNQKKKVERGSGVNDPTANSWVGAV